MKIIWLGHASFRIEIAGQILLIDPWLLGNPSFPDARRDEAIAGTDHILITHGHFDHTNEVSALARETRAKIVGIPEVCAILDGDGIESIDFNKGGTVHLGDVAVTMVTASHSSSVPSGDGPIYAGTESGYMIEGEGHTIYVSGDTDIMADMAWMGELHAPDIGILCAGGHYTMDMKRAAYAANKYFDFKVVIPCHYGTFGLLEQNADVLVAALPDVDVKTPAVMEVVEI